MPSEPTPRSIVKQNGIPMRKYLQFGVVALTVAMLGAELFLYVPPLRPTRTLSVVIQDLQGRVSVNSNLWSSYTGSYRQVYSWGPGPSQVKTIYYYYDANYPTANVGYVSWVGLPYHIEEVIGYRELALQVVILNATQLRSFLTDPSTVNDSLLIVAAGAFPDTVFTSSTNLVAPWIQQGGRLLWIGAAIGYYVAEPFGSPGGPPFLLTAGPTGVSRFLRLSMLGGPAAYDNATIESTALNMNFAAGLAGYGFDIAALQRAGGEVIGNQANGYTNGALVPYGAGFLIDLAGDMNTPMENELSTNIVNMLQFGLPEGQVRILDYHDVEVSAGEAAEWTLTVSLPNGNPTGRRFCVFTSQTDLTAFFGNVTCT